MICVTGAGGTVGSEVVRQLQIANASFRAAYHSQAKADAANGKGIDAVVIDYSRPDTMRQAFAGCDRVFLLGPNMSNQVELEKSAVEAAKASGVRQIVKLSAMNADGEEYDLGRIHREVEKAIEASGLDWTFLRPNSFMQNSVNFRGGSIRAESAFYTAAEDARISQVDVRDIAAVAVKALTESGHAGKAYALNGPEAITYDEMGAQISAALGRTVNHVNIPPEYLRAGILQQGLPEDFADQLLDLERYYREGKAAIDENDIKAVTGREPRRFADFAHEMAAAGVWNKDSTTGA